MKSTALLFGFLGLLMMDSCKDEANNANSYVPSGVVNLVINTDLPEYFRLKTRGNYIYAPGGNRGVIVIHDFDDTYVAIERTCSFEPDKECSKLYVDSSSINIRCGSFNQSQWIPCGDSRFMYSGQVTLGPAQYPLRQYLVSENGNTLTIRN